VAGEVEQAVEFEVQQFPDAHAGGAQQLQSRAAEGVVEPSDGGHQRGILVRWQGAGHRLGQPRQVGDEQQSAPRRRRPAPVGDVLEEAA